MKDSNKDVGKVLSEFKKLLEAEGKRNVVLISLYSDGAPENLVQINYSANGVLQVVGACEVVKDFILNPRPK